MTASGRPVALHNDCPTVSTEMCNGRVRALIIAYEQINRHKISGAKALSNRKFIAKLKPKIGLQHNIYSLQQSTYTKDLF